MSDMRRMMMMFTRPVEVGPVLPYGAKVEYLRSSGAQYINTGIIYIKVNNTNPIYKLGSEYPIKILTIQCQIEETGG